MKMNRILFVIVLGVLLAQETQAFYNQSTGRWLSRDPIGERGGANLNAFVANAPIHRFDRLGLEGSPAGPPGVPSKSKDLPVYITIKVKPCHILMLYGHNFSGSNKDGLNLISDIQSTDPNSTGCTWATVNGCFADQVPNSISLPAYQPTSGQIEVRNSSEDNDLARETYKAEQAAIKQAKEQMCKTSSCKCPKIYLDRQSFGLTKEEAKVFPAPQGHQIDCKTGKVTNNIW